jgi:MFS family permease
VRDTLAPLADARARPLLLGHLLGRMTPGMMVLAIVLAAREGGYGYAVAGLVAGGHQLGVAVGSPLQGRLADAVGHRRLLLPDGAVYLVATAALAAGLRVGLPPVVLTALAVAAGLASPPVTACTRAALGAIYGPGRARERAYVLTVVNVELGFIVGPLVTGAISVTLGAAAAVVAAGAAVSVATLVYASAPKDVATAANGDLRTALRPTGLVAVLRAPGLLAAAAAFLAVATSFGAFDLFAAAVAEAFERPSLAGTYIALIAAASLTGGLVYGARVRTGPLRGRMRRLALIAGDPVLLGLVLAVTGAIIGPLNVCGFQLVDDLSPPTARAEAQSWIQAAVYLGGAAGGVVGGAVVDLVGSAPVMLVGAVGSLAAVVVLGRSRALRAVERTG